MVAAEAFRNRRKPAGSAGRSQPAFGGAVSGRSETAPLGASVA